MKLADLLADRFEIEQQIAKGGMGEVFRAHDRISGEAVAVKVIFDERGHRTARFAREVELLAELSHPGIVRYIAHGETPSGEIFLAMEWLDGEDLEARLLREALTMDESVTLATRVAEALGAAHARGIVHRDLKPSNLFLLGGSIEHVKVLDFGVARREGRTELTQTGTMIGTPGYMAPEQARNSGVIDARADVFALGCVLFQCLTGTPAFDGDNTAGILGKILFGEALRVSALLPDVPEGLDALVAQMLAKDPALRPRDGANLAAALAALGPLVRSPAGASRTRLGQSSSITVGERRFLSVVVVGSPPEDGEPGDEPADEALGRAEARGRAEALQRAIEPYGGRLEQLADGTTIVVLEADRQVATDQAVQAARCALAMRPFANGRPMAIAMGRAESTRRLPEGDVIDRASGLVLHLAKASGDLPPIALDEVIAGLLDARFDVIEGEAGLMLYGERPVRQGARTLLGRPTACVGRDWELGALVSIFEECIDEGEARVVVVTAAAGMGKTRLGGEFLNRIRQRRGELVLWAGRGDSLRAGSTLDLLAQALRWALGIQGGEPLAERHDKIRTRVAEHVPLGDQKRVAEFLGELVGAPFPGDDETGAALRAARQDAQLMSEQMRKAWMDFLKAETSVHPVLLALEDLHWGDFGTVQFIDAALRERSAHPWMVLALARPEVYEVFPRLWAERKNVQQIRLKELGRKAGERLVRQVLGDSVGPETMERLVKQADGNAFYLEELIRAVAEGKDKALPETVMAMIETRLGRLAVEPRRVLRAASVFGAVCWEGGVAVLLGGAMGATLVGEWLTKLVEQEVLTLRPESRFPGERAFRFRHALLREGAYAMLTEDDKRRGHRLAGEWLEQHGESDPIVLAGHFERGGEGAKAGGYYLHAAEQASLAGDVAGAEARAHLGLACEVSTEVRASLLGLLCEVSYYDPRKVSAAMTYADEVMGLAPRGSVSWARGAAAKILGALHGGKIEDLVATLRTFREVEPAPEAVNALVFAANSGVFVLDVLGRIEESNQLMALIERFCEVNGPVREQRSIAAALWRIGRAARDSHIHEDPWGAFEHGRAGRRLCEALNHTVLLTYARGCQGMNLWYLGAFAEAEQVLGDATPSDDELGTIASMWLFCLAWLRADRGALDEARRTAERLLALGQSGHLLMEGRGHWALAEVLRRDGDLEGAEREIQAARGILTTVSPRDAAAILSTLGLVRLAQGRVAEALTTAADAFSRYDAMRTCGFFRAAFVRLAHAEALEAAGDHAAAFAAITVARARLLAVVDRIADPGYQKSFLEDVPENARTLALAATWLGE
jgi:predicted Ser/Thr protein kinase